MEIIVIQKIKTGQRQKEYLYLSCSLLQHLFQPYSLYLMQKLRGLWILIFLQVTKSFTFRVNLRPIKKTDFGTNVEGEMSGVFQNCTNVYPLR